jgi:outer membrane protein assembly factor BamB
MFKNKLKTILFSTLAAMIFIQCGSVDQPGDAWKTYRYDNSRSGYSPASITLPMELKWHFRSSQPPRPAWPAPSEEMKRIQMDNALHTVAAYGSVFFASSEDHSVYALDIQTGKEQWHFFAQGPVRYAPSVCNKRLYFGSDDGLVYCLNAKTGKMIWNYRAGPTSEKVLGNGHMISLWPVRSSVLIDKGVVYFGAGVFPYEGLYICALDAKDGHVVWKNDTIGDREHELIFGGISPQSYLLASDNILYIPSSRAMPAAFDKKTGEFLYYLEPGGKIGGVWALLDEDHLIAGIDLSGTPAKAVYDEKTGEKQEDMHAWFPGIDLVVSRDISFTLTKDGVYALDRKQYLNLQKNQLKDLREKKENLRSRLRDINSRISDANAQTLDKLNQERGSITHLINELAEVEGKLKPEMFKWAFIRKNLYTMIRAGDILFAGGDGHIIGLNTQTGEKQWELDVSGKVMGLTAVKNHLIASTDMGDVYCFATNGSSTKSAEIKQKNNNPPFKNNRKADLYRSGVKNLLSQTGIQKGYALVLSDAPEQLAYELAKQTELYVVAPVKNEKQANKARKKLFSSGLYGTKVIFEPWDLEYLPDYFANLIIVDKKTWKTNIFSSKEIFRVLKPYGGTAVFGSFGKDDQNEFKNNAKELKEWLKEVVPESRIKMHEDTPWLFYTRGELEGVGAWTEEYGNPGNTACSGDELVKGPLAVLWFGEPGSKQMLDRHAKAQSPLSKDGRLFIQGEEVILAYDAYNGTRLWEKELPGAVRPRADVDGGNFSLNSTGLFVGAKDHCYKLDPGSGKTQKIFALPDTPASGAFRWAHVSSTETTLFGSRGMALPREYFFIRNTLTEETKWKNLEDIPEEYQDLYISMKTKYPDPEDGLLEDFKRSGILWRVMTEFPDWENYNIQQGALTDRIMTSDMVFALEPQTGKIKWIHRGHKIAHITISKESEKIFFAENQVTSADKEKARKEMQRMIQDDIYIQGDERHVKESERDFRTVFALDKETGKLKWEKTLDFTGCGGDALASAAHNGVLVFFSNVGSHDAWRHKTGTLRWKRMIALSAENGKVLWSRANNYRTRPVIVENRIYIEPRVCDLHTGKILNRTHPVSGLSVPFEYLRPGHTCAVTSASSSMLFFRSSSTAFMDFEKDDGVSLFGAIRPGCWISLIPASGVLLYPEASAGCTCSYPIRGSLVLKHKKHRWSKGKMFITHGPMTPVKHFSINLGSVSDMKDSEGNIWFAYPNPDTNYTSNHYPDYGVKFDLNDQVPTGMGYFSGDYRNISLSGTDKPWLFTSGAAGITSFEIPLIDDIWGEAPGTYTVRLGFKAPSNDRKGQRVFDIKIQGETAASNFDIRRETKAGSDVVIRDFTGMSVSNTLIIELVPRMKNPGLDKAPVINFIQVLREDDPGIMAEVKNEALKNHHSILKRSTQKDLKIKALEGIAFIADPVSLPLIKNYCENIDPIIRDYRDQDKDLKKSATLAFLAIADKIAEQDKDKSFRMLNRAMAFTSQEDLGTLQEITSRLRK